MPAESLVPNSFYRESVVQRHCFIIDAFAAERFAGNPAAVVLDAQGLDDRDMQHIAAEFNLSETTFVLPPQSPPADHDFVLSVRFRWFTPAVEVDMCGHATIAGIHALLESGRIRHDDPASSTKVHIETKSGPLTGFVESVPGQPDRRMIWLEMIPPKLTPIDFDLSDVAVALRISPDTFESSLPPVRTQDRDIIAFVYNFMVLNAIRPDFARLAELLTARGARGLCLSTVHTLTPSVHVQSRFFAPNFGINEDPVTGSVTGPLAACLADRGLVPITEGIAGVTCVQGVPGGRTGLLYALVHIPERAPEPLSPTGGEGRVRGVQDSSLANRLCTVRIGGQAVTTIRGTLFV